jgi:nickel superoxide dismutase
MFYRIIRTIANSIPSEVVYAHCDVPCGIYDPKGAQTAAATVLKMVEKLQATDLPDVSNKQLLLEYDNTTTRMIMTKEEHAQKCKTELLILWTDYFKPEHLAKFPNLHDTFWKAAKLCSANKQSVDVAKAQELVSAVDEIATIFQQSKAAK